MRLRAFHLFNPVIIPICYELRFFLVSLINDTAIRFMRSLFYSCIEERFVEHKTSRFDTTRCGYNQFWLRVINPNGKLMSSKTSKNDRMNSAKTSTTKHCNYSLRYHGHINNYSITFDHTMTCQYACKFSSQIA